MEASRTNIGLAAVTVSATPIRVYCLWLRQLTAGWVR